MNPRTFDPFEGLSAQTATKAKNDLEVTDLAQTAYAVMARLQRLTTPWNQLKEDCREAWRGVVRLAISTIDSVSEEQGEIQIVVMDFAKALHNQFIAEMYAKSWDEIGQAEKTYWQAIVRHLANLIDSDGKSLDFPELEDRIVAWAQDRLGASQPLTV